MVKLRKNRWVLPLVRIAGLIDDVIYLATRHETTIAIKIMVAGGRIR